MTTTTTQLAKVDPIIRRLAVARDALRTATTLPQIKTLHSMAAAAEVYARQQALSEESIAFAHQVKIEALARLGQVLEDIPKRAGARGAAGPGKGKRGVKQSPRFDEPATYEELGLTEHVARSAHKIAALSDTELTAVAAGDKTLAAVTRERDGGRA